MANPYGEGFDELKNLVGEANKGIEEGAKRADALLAEAARTGQKLRIPAVGQPSLTEKVSPAVAKALNEETAAHSALADAIQRHEAARAKLRANQARLKGGEGGND